MSLKNSWTSMMANLCDMAEAKSSSSKNIQDKGTV
jgi:hypothetical protein